MTGCSVAVDRDRLTAELTALAGFSDAQPPGVTRVLFTEADRRAREFVRNLCTAAGLSVRCDAIGNQFARWAGTEPASPAVATGSHIDAIPNSGKYDGTVGVLGGLEAIRALQEAGFRPRRSIELITFTSEEPTRFGIGCLGSRSLCGDLTPDALCRLRDSDDHWFDHVRQAAGFHGDLRSVRLSSGVYDSFVELHIEQGPLLERSNVPIGVVTAIAAPAALRVTLEGAGGHAGGVLMPDRRDALCAAAEIILAVESAARSSGSADTVGTTGICRVHPGAINSIPGRVVLEIDVRDIRLASRDAALAEIRSAIERVGAKRNIEVAVATLNSDAPGDMDARVVAAAENSCRQRCLAPMKMISRAYHDSLFMSRICPTGMIFIPCRDGVSHRPDEFASPEAIASGVAVLALTLAELAT